MTKTGYRMKFFAGKVNKAGAGVWKVPENQGKKHLQSLESLSIIGVVKKERRLRT